MSRSLILHFLILLLLLFGGGVLIILLPSQSVHWAIIGFLAVTYLVWAFWHHHETNTLNKEALLEYGLIVAIIALVLLLI